MTVCQQQSKCFLAVIAKTTQNWICHQILIGSKIDRESIFVRVYTRARATFQWQEAQLAQNLRAKNSGLKKEQDIKLTCGIFHLSLSPRLSVSVLQTTVHNYSHVFCYRSWEGEKSNTRWQESGLMDAVRQRENKCRGKSITGFSFWVKKWDDVNSVNQSVKDGRFVKWSEASSRSR